MSESVFSTYWYRVANIKPVLRDVVDISRHVYRGQPWYVLRNSLNGRSHRFNTVAYALIGQMDGRRTVEEIWENASKRSADTFPTQDEVIRMLGKLHDADLIESDVLPATGATVMQLQGVGGRSWKQQVANPFSFRVPLWNPDSFLSKWAWITAPVFSRGGLVLWLVIVFSALVTAGLHWPELSGNLSDRLLLPGNLLMLWLAFPIVKAFHELGHGFALKKWGGDVHEMGLLFILFTPIPYVDATASAMFSEKRRRIAVAAMGMMVELLIASVALFVWVNVETGLIRTVAYNVMLIGGASTVLFNGNPLLRYDGYFILSDQIEIPNLGQRSTRYLGYLLQRYLLGIETVESPVTAPGERRWFLVYGPLSFCYRIAVLVGLVLLVSSRFLGVGVFIAIWGVISLLLFPAVRTLFKLLNHLEVRRRRVRLVGVGGGGAALVVFVFFVIPVPFWTSTQGVVWLPEHAVIRAGTDCEVAELLAPVEQLVVKDTPLIRGVDPILTAERAVYKARLEELYARYNGEPFQHRVKRRMLLDEIDLVRKDLKQCEETLAKLQVRSQARGLFILADEKGLSGRHVKKGEVLGYILAEHHPRVRAVVRQADIGLVRGRISGVEVRLAAQSARVFPAYIERIVPSAELNLPSAALGTGFGGNIPVDPTDPDGVRALETIFHVDINLLEMEGDVHIGGRVYVRFEHGRMPLAMQWYRSLRQLFLRKFHA